MNSPSIIKPPLPSHLPPRPPLAEIPKPSNSIPAVSHAPLQSSQAQISALSQKNASVYQAHPIGYNIEGSTLISSQHGNKEKAISIKTQIKTEFQRINQLYEIDTENLTNVFASLEACLELAGCVKIDQKKQTYVDYAKQASADLKRKNYFSAYTHYAQHLVTTFEGINCQLVEKDKIRPNSNVIIGAIYQLLRTIALDPSSQTYKKALKELLIDFNTIIGNLIKDNNADQTACEDMQLFLRSIEDELKGKNNEPADPFKSEFIVDPKLFKQVFTAPTSLLKQFPHLSNMASFTQKYPGLGLAGLFYDDRKPDPDVLDKILDSVVKDPFVNMVLYYNPNNPKHNPVLTSEEACKLRDAMLKNPDLRMQFKTQESAQILADSFTKSNLFSQGQLLNHKIDSKGNTYHNIFIDPRASFVRKK